MRRFSGPLRAEISYFPHKATRNLSEVIALEGLFTVDFPCANKY